MLNCFTKSLPNCCAKWIFGIILRQIAAPNQYLRSICAKNVRQILFESLFCAEDLSEIHPQIHPGIFVKIGIFWKTKLTISLGRLEQTLSV
jgi:hypothetical protein